MSDRDRDRWNLKHADCQPASTVRADGWLMEALDLVDALVGRSETCRRALDVACGLGHNAIWLAQQGWQVDGVGISAKGLEIARQSAAAAEVDVRWIEADLDQWNPLANEYDLVAVFRFLDRKTVPQIVHKTLSPGGWLVYETFSGTQREPSNHHVSNPAYLLSPGELCTLFPDLEVVAHQQEALPDRKVQRLLGRREI